MEYKGRALTCTQAELDAFKAAILVSHTLHNFDELYNGVQLPNETGNPVAKYYALTVNEAAVLQTFVPNAAGFQPITDQNAATVIQAHSETIIDPMIFARFEKTPERANSQTLEELRAENAELRGQLAATNRDLQDLALAVFSA